MKTILKTIGFALIIAISTTTFAQNKKHKNDHLTVEQKAQKRTDRLTKKLELSSEQSKKAYAINLDLIKEMEAAKKEMKALKTKIKANKEKAKTDLDKILTAEQRVKLETLRKNHQAKKDSKHPKKPKHPAHPEHHEH